MMKHLIAAIAALLVAACAPDVDPDVENAKIAVQKKLKDPESAQFKHIVKYTSSHYSPGSNTAVCGEVNSKNSYGGYIGFNGFLVMPPMITLFEEQNPEVFSTFRSHYCRDDFKEMKHSN